MAIQSLAASGFATRASSFRNDRARPASFWDASSLFQNPQSLIDLLLQLRLTPNREQQARACVSRGRHDVSLSRPVYFLALGGVDYDLDDKRSESAWHFIFPYWLLISSISSGDVSLSILFLLCARQYSSAL